MNVTPSVKQLALSSSSTREQADALVARSVAEAADAAQTAIVVEAVPAPALVVEALRAAGFVAVAAATGVLSSCAGGGGGWPPLVLPRLGQDRGGSFGGPHEEEGCPVLRECNLVNGAG